MNYVLQVSDRDFAIIWAALGELPSKHTFALMTQLREQVEQQEAALAEATQGGENEQG